MMSFFVIIWWIHGYHPVDYEVQLFNQPVDVSSLACCVLAFKYYNYGTLFPEKLILYRFQASVGKAVWIFLFLRENGL
jgi:hypothetical protein